MHPKIIGSHTQQSSGIAYDYTASIQIESTLWTWEAKVWRSGGVAKIVSGAVEFESPPERLVGFELVRRSIARKIDAFSPD